VAGEGRGTVGRLKIKSAVRATGGQYRLGGIRNGVSERLRYGGATTILHLCVGTHEEDLSPAPGREHLLVSRANQPLSCGVEEVKEEGSLG